VGAGTVTALQALLAHLAGESAAQLMAATDADLAGDRYARFLVERAAAAGIDGQRLRPPRGLKGWNDVWRAAARRRDELSREGALMDMDARPRPCPRQSRPSRWDPGRTVHPGRPLPSSERTGRIGHVDTR
jgi:hypothetical protein